MHCTLNLVELRLHLVYTALTKVFVHHLILLNDFCRIYRLNSYLDSAFYRCLRPMVHFMSHTLVIIELYRSILLVQKEVCLVIASRKLFFPSNDDIDNKCFTIHETRKMWLLIKLISFHLYS